MLCTALTGISQEALRDLRRGKPRTLELQSTHNVVTAAETNPGDHIFMTSVDKEDLSPGDSGIMAEVLSINITMKRMIEFNSGLHFEERERISARIQVRFCSTTTVKEVVDEGYTRPTRVDVIRCTSYHAG